MARAWPTPGHALPESAYYPNGPAFYVGEFQLTVLILSNTLPIGRYRSSASSAVR